MNQSDNGVRAIARRIMGALGLFSIAAFGVMCGPSADSFCDAVCDCRGCSNRDFDDCVYDFDREDDFADRRGCSPEWGDYIDCVASGDGCRGRDADHYCDREKDDWKRCID